MASKLYQIAFQLGAKLSSSFGSTFASAQRQMGNLNERQIEAATASEKASKGFLGLGEGLGNVVKMAAGVAGGIGFAEIAKQSIELASDLNEVQNVVDTTFGNGSKQIDAWSKTALNAFGLSELQAKQFTGTMGAMMKSSGIAGDKLVDMSENLSGLAGDFASFYNLDIGDSFEKIKSGISGETEPLKSLGINMSVANLQAYALSQGIKKSWNNMSQAEQIQMRYGYLLSVSKDAQGDFNKTQQSFANQVRIAKTNLAQLGATIGAKVLPFLDGILIGFNSLMTTGPKVIENIKNYFTSGSSGISTSFNKISSSFATFKTNLSSGTSISQAFWASFKSSLGEGAAGAISNMIGYFEFGTKGLISFLKGDMKSAGDFFYAMFPDEAGTQDKVNKIISILSGLKASVINAFSQGKANIAAFGKSISDIASKYGPPLISFALKFGQGFVKMIPLFQKISQSVIGAFIKISPVISGVVGIIVNNVLPPLLKLFNFIATNIVPLVASAFVTYMPRIAQMVNNLWTIISPILKFLIGLITMVGAEVGTVALGIINFVANLAKNLFNILDGIIQFISGVFTGNWSSAWEGVTKIFSGIFGTLGTLLKAPLNAVITLINASISGINQINFKIPDWVPGLGGQQFGINIPKIPQLAQGGYIRHRAGGILANIGEGNEDEIVSPVSKLKSILGGAQGALGQVMQVTYQITIQGNASEDDVYAGVERGNDDLEKRLKQIDAKKQRLSFQPG
ncbi:hypothetical protein [Desulfosporosinus sp. FKB]|uniref:phage tail protein n=1 Tax=Desulfosporosinus sp. FKB TaxID=1969835 RepID=UPI000B49CFAF|nr:hypothetical protein [Desulfosporosinus sp. FKB]